MGHCAWSFQSPPAIYGPVADKPGSRQSRDAGPAEVEGP